MYRSIRHDLPIIIRRLRNTSKTVVKPKDFSAEKSVDVQPFKLHGLDNGPPTSVKLSTEDAKLYYQQMSTIRRIENISSTLYKGKFIRGFLHLYSGQEGCAVGMKAAMRDVDTIITSYRGHGWSYLMGTSAHAVLAELTGRATGCSRGKGGSLHMYAPNFYGGNGIVAAQVPLGTGIGLERKYQNTGGVSLTLYGDGAANQGQVFESFNMAYLWKLPVLFICENNRYGMGTSSERAASNVNFYARGDVIPGIWVDGMDVLAVRSATEFAIDYVLENGPLVMEAYTYRYGGHSMSDPGISYRSREEVQAVRDTQDPIVQFKKKCIELELLSEESCKAIDDDVKKEVDEAAEKSKTDKETDLVELTYDVYVNHVGIKVRGPSGQALNHEARGKPMNLK